MFGIGFVELIVISVVALLVVGPKRLPELGHFVGRGVREIQRLIQEIKNEIDFDANRMEEKPGESHHMPPDDEKAP